KMQLVEGVAEENGPDLGLLLVAAAKQRQQRVSGFETVALNLRDRLHQFPTSASPLAPAAFTIGSESVVTRPGRRSSSRSKSLARGHFPLARTNCSTASERRSGLATISTKRSHSPRLGTTARA